MSINAAVLGTGERFKKYYFEPILRLQNESILKLKFFYNRDTAKIKKYEEIFKCRVTNDIKELLSDKTIDLFIITLPIHLRKKLFFNKNFNSKFVLSEAPLVNNLLEYVKLKKIFEKKNISYEIFEDKFYYDYSIINNYNLTKLSIYNKFWEHHALSCFFKINSKKLGKINFISRKVFYNQEIFTIVYGDVKLNYIFSLNKKNVDRSKGIIKAFYSDKKKKVLKKLILPKKIQVMLYINVLII